MPSPFPGMDPYLEDPTLWSEFHGRLAVAAATALNRLLPKGYIARLDRYVWIHDPSTAANVLLGEPDAYVTGPDQAATAQPARGRAATATAAIIFPVRRRQGNRFIRIIDPKSKRVVTAIEILSPANKTGGYRRAYRRKREEYLARGVHLVEMDFLRHGRRLPLGLLKPPRSAYYILVCRAAETPHGDLWNLSVRDPLPVIPIPLDPGVADIQLPVRACFDQVYEDARFAEEIDYGQPPTPPLREADAAWARELLAARKI
ncbi:MAG: DUF4058 family protein [Planctomycetia bacterium]|nr:DUF4058 family protein [Planctomycetia bacterium]